MSIKTVPDAVLADATVVSSGRPIHLTPGNRKDLKRSQMAKGGGHEKLIAAIHLTPGHKKNLIALTNGKYGSGELWMADTSHTWTQKRFKNAHKCQMRQW